MQHQSKLLTIHKSSLSCTASSDVQCPMHDIVQEIPQFDHALLSRPWKATADTAYTTVSDNLSVKTVLVMDNFATIN